MFAQIYDCPKCGHVWHTYSDEVINIEQDDVETYLFCSECDSVVRPLLSEDGKPVFHVLTPDEMQAEMIDSMVYTEEEEEYFWGDEDG